MNSLTAKIMLVAMAGVTAFASVAADTPRDRAEKAPAQEPARPEAGKAADTPVALDLDKLKRSKRDKPIPDLLAPVRVASPDAGKPSAPEAPSAPALPFNYIGRLTGGGKELVFISRGDDSFSAHRGQTIDKQYRLEQITETALTFIYLPLGTRQVLNVPATN